MLSLVAAQSAVPRLIFMEEAGSTNDELAAIAAAEVLPAWTTLVTANQTAGRGRRDRSWSTPPGRGLAISVLVPPLPADRSVWLPLAAGLAMRDAVQAVIGTTVALKWPNDVLIGGLKVCGVLGRFGPGGAVLGAGLNVRQREDELPVPTATSLVLEGAVDSDLDDRALAGYLSRLQVHVGGLVRADAERSGLRRAVVDACETLGREVRVELPDGSSLVGDAVDIAADARLVLRSSDGPELHVAAGDVVHLRRTS